MKFIHSYINQYKQKQHTYLQEVSDSDESASPWLCMLVKKIFWLDTTAWIDSLYTCDIINMVCTNELLTLWRVDQYGYLDTLLSGCSSNIY